MQVRLRPAGLGRGAAVAAPAPRHARGLARGAPVVLRENQLHGPFEHRARRPGARREPLLELGAFYTQERGELVAPALQVLALLQNARTHLGPSRLVNHGAAASKFGARVVIIPMDMG